LVHEYESSEREKSAAAVVRGPFYPSKYLKSLKKCADVAFLSNAAADVIFCTGNDLKTLALCAARSHIVAVR
jgi:hypothetical protein